MARTRKDRINENIESKNGAAVSSSDLVRPAAKYLRPDAMCKWLGVSKRTLSSWQERKLIPYIIVKDSEGKGRTVLFDLDEVANALNAFKV